MKLSELLQESDISLEDSLNFVSDGMVIVNSKLEVLFYNSAAVQIRGFPPEGHYTEWPKHIGIYNKDKK